MPTDWGLKPPIDVFPHNAQERAMSSLGFESVWGRGRGSPPAAYYSIAPR
jgi:hypothetical protein